MFDVGFLEFALAMGVGLVVLGPARLPQAVRALGLWRRRLSSWINAARWELEQDLGTEDLRRLRRDGYLDAPEAPAGGEAEPPSAEAGTGTPAKRASRRKPKGNART